MERALEESAAGAALEVHLIGFSPEEVSTLLRVCERLRPGEGSAEEAEAGEATEKADAAEANEADPSEKDMEDPIEEPAQVVGTGEPACEEGGANSTLLRLRNAS